jgi:GST-like protein
MIDLYTAPTPNGHKASCTLEELELDYSTHFVNITEGDQHQPHFRAINPNGRIPAIVDRAADNFAVFESGAIMIYLAELTGKLLPTDVKGRSQVIQWLMFQMGGVGPMFGQVGFFHHFAGKEIEDPRPRERYYTEAKRLLGVMDRQLAGRDWIAGDYSIADIALCPWLRTLRDFYGAREEVGFDGFTNVSAWLDRFLARPAVQRGLKVPARV